MEREEWEHAEWEEHKRAEAARVAAEKEEVWKVQRASKRAEKWKATVVSLGSFLQVHTIQ